jgi:lipopolysaccharide/colanic/teichoic acid biosynthesis glycosyltransferase
MTATSSDVSYFQLDAVTAPRMAALSGPYSEAASVTQTRARAAKRAFDLAFGTALALASFPAAILIALAVVIQSGGPVFYSQQRVGRGGRSISVWKFRTMVVEADAVLQQYLDRDPALAAEWRQNRKLRRDPRVTGIGRLLRKTSLDELPQLWNVIRGDMSLVGPRPVVADELGRYGANSSLYLAVKPGLTGLWQTSGRNNTTYDHRVKLDSEYVRTWSIAKDLQIVLNTIPAVVRGAGAC